jgi:hypothetical protein
MQRQDREVLQRLGLNPGAVVSWTDIVERIRTHIAPEQLPDICGACRWLPLGYCAESLDRLRRSAPAFIDVR